MIERGNDAMRREIKPNDTVLHKPSGEKWTVAGVNEADGTLIPCGYPFPSCARTEDCEILEHRYEVEMQSAEIITWFYDHGYPGYIDVRSALYQGLMREDGTWSIPEMRCKK